MKERRSSEADREAARHLERMQQQSEKLLGGAPAEASDEPEDAIERWGRRIGRGIGVLIAAYLIWHLATTYL